MQRLVLFTALSLLLFAVFPLLPFARECAASVNLTEDRALTSPLESLKTRAKMGDERAQLRLGNIYYRGRGVTQNYDKAYQWFKNAAEQGVTEAQYNLGRMYLTGQSVGRDYILSYMWFNLANAGGDVRSIPELNSLEAKMTPEEVAKAQKLSRKFLAEKIKVK